VVKYLVAGNATRPRVVPAAARTGRNVRPVARQPSLPQTLVMALWLSPGERAHKAEFWREYEQRFGPIPANNPPVAMLKTWFRQWKKTGVAAGPWLDANPLQAPPTGGPPGGGSSGGSNV
jgi:hypothetical protein